MSLKLCCLSFILIFTFEAHCQAKVNSTSIYQLAYSHILAISEFKEFTENNKCVAVFDSIIYLDRVTFNIQFDVDKKYFTENKEHILIDSLDRTEITNKQKPYFYSPVATLTRRSASKRQCWVVAFSKRNDNWLMAEVIQNDNGGRSLQEIMPMFGQSLRYLIFFQPNGEIERHYTQVINYN